MVGVASSCAVGLAAAAALLSRGAVVDAFAPHRLGVGREIGSPPSRHVQVSLGARRAPFGRPQPAAASGDHHSSAQKEIKVGVIGAGRIGIVHLEALASCPGIKPVIISNPTVSKAEAAAKKYNLPEWSASADDVINHPDVDAVWICSPSQFHAQQIKACAAKGKHIFCEKPIATDVPETIEAINACKEANVKLMTALQRRFDYNFARVRKAIEDGTVGDIVQVKLCSRDPSPPPIEYVKGGGGIFKDMAVHDLDMSRFLMGSEPKRIMAVGSCMIDKAIETLEGPEAYDTATIVVEYEGGRTATIDVCRQAVYGYDQRAEVLGTKGMIITDNAYPNSARVYLKDYTGEADMPFDFFMSRYKEAYVSETKAFAEALVKDLPSPCTGEDGLMALIMAIAAGKSATEGRWVSFDEVEEVTACKDPDHCEIIDPREYALQGTTSVARVRKRDVIKDFFGNLMAPASG